MSGQRMRVSVLGLLACALASGVGCADAATGPERVAPAGVRVSVSDATLASLGDTLRVTAVAIDAKGTALPGIPLRWRVERAGVVDTIRGGTFLSVANGQVRVWAELEQATGGIERGVGYDADVAAAPVQVTVSQRAAQVAVSAPTAVLWSQGARVALSAAARDARGNPIADAGSRVRWSSSDPRIATVDSTGVVRAVTDGEVTMRAALEGVETGVPIRVSATVGLESCVTYDDAVAPRCAAPLRFTIKERVP
jgi:hypothetical protein